MTESELTYQKALGSYVTSRYVVVSPSESPTFQTLRCLLTDSCSVVQNAEVCLLAARAVVQAVPIRGDSATTKIMTRTPPLKPHWRQAKRTLHSPERTTTDTRSATGKIFPSFLFSRGPPSRGWVNKHQDCIYTAVKAQGATLSTDDTTSTPGKMAYISQFDQAAAEQKGKLHPEFMQLTDDELAFFKQVIGLHDEAELVAHIVRIQEDAYEVHSHRLCANARTTDRFVTCLQVFPYPCIRWFDFVRYSLMCSLIVLRLMGPPMLLGQLGSGYLASLHTASSCSLAKSEVMLYTSTSALAVCISSIIVPTATDKTSRSWHCDTQAHPRWFPGKELHCIGPQARYIVPVSSWTLLLSSVAAEFWDMGYKLFRDSPGTFTVPFVQGDVLSPSFLEPSPPIYTPLVTPTPDLTALTSLTPLAGRLSAIHASYLIHLFGEDRQLQIARALGGLLDPRPGSVIFGQHVGAPKKGTIIIYPTGEPVPMFCHSPESWTELWDGTVFKKGSVRVEVELLTLPVPRGALDHTYWQLVWSVTRL